MYLHKLALNNIRCLEKAEVHFQYPGRIAGEDDLPLPSADPYGKYNLQNVNLILGINGSGKTTVLRGSALALIAPVLRDSGYHPYAVIRRKKAGLGAPLTKARVSGEVVLNEQDGPGRSKGTKSSRRSEGKRLSLDVEFIRKGTSDTVSFATEGTGVWAPMYDRDSAAFLVVGYGASRRVTNQTSDPTQAERRSILRYMRVQSLFEEGYPLIPLSAWLPELQRTNKGRWTQVVGLINKALGDEYDFRGDFVDGEYHIQQKGIILPMGALSDGYRSYIGWVGDMLYHICMGAPNGARLVENCGVVLVDEIDLHLHPEWQRRVIPTIAATFPNIQFIFTTHSPIVVGSVEWSNIHVLSENDGPVQTGEAVSGLSAEQILLSPYFGLHTTRSERKVEELRDLEVKAQAAVSAKGTKEQVEDRVFSAAMDYMRSLTLGTEAFEVEDKPEKTRAPPRARQKAIAKAAAAKKKKKKR